MASVEADLTEEEAEASHFNHSKDKEEEGADDSRDSAEDSTKKIPKLLSIRDTF